MLILIYSPLFENMIVKLRHNSHLDARSVYLLFISLERLRKSKVGYCDLQESILMPHVTPSDMVCPFVPLAMPLLLINA